MSEAAIWVGTKDFIGGHTNFFVALENERIVEMEIESQKLKYCFDASLDSPPVKTTLNLINPEVVLRFEGTSFFDKYITLTMHITDQPPYDFENWFETTVEFRVPKDKIELALQEAFNTPSPVMFNIEQISYNQKFIG